MELYDDSKAMGKNTKIYSKVICRPKLLRVGFMVIIFQNKTEHLKS